MYNVITCHSPISPGNINTLCKRVIYILYAQKRIRLKTVFTEKFEWIISYFCVQQGG